MPSSKESQTSGVEDRRHMKRALTIARRGQGLVSPNPAVGAVLVRQGNIIGEGWHHGPGQPHAEIEAIRDALRQGTDPKGSTLYVTLEPCSTEGRTPPCTSAIVKHQIKIVHAATEDPNPQHSGSGFALLRNQGVTVRVGLCNDEATQLNLGFNHWIVHQTPLITIKSAMTLDGKIATATGQSKWITGPKARAKVMKMRFQHDAILVGIETLLADDPSLTVRTGKAFERMHPKKELRRFVLDSKARTPLSSQICNDSQAHLTTIVVGNEASSEKIRKLQRKVTVWKLRTSQTRISLKALLKRLGRDGITSLMVEGGGEVNAAFIEQRLATRIAFFYAPKILGGVDSRPAVGGRGFNNPETFLRLCNTRWQSLGSDLLLTANIQSSP